jgi:hypothetical protein
MAKTLFFILISAFVCSYAFAEEAKVGENDFITNTVSDIVGKVNQYTSGEKEILQPVDEAGGGAGYTVDNMGRKVPIKTGKDAALNEKI